jgi:hypothetical protein
MEGGSSPWRRCDRVSRLSAGSLTPRMALRPGSSTWLSATAEMISHHEGLEILEHMEIQLRDYRIKPGHMDDWIRGWEGGVVPLRRQEGFEVVGAWVDRAHDRFVWLVGYSGPDGIPLGGRGAVPRQAGTTVVESRALRFHPIRNP